MKSPDKAVKLRFFVLAFGCTFLVLGLMGLVAVYLLMPGQPAVSSQETSADTFYLPDAEDDLTLFWVCRRENSDTPAFFALIRLDMLAGRIPVCFFPLETALSPESGYATLAQAYAGSGAPGAAKALSQSFTLSVDRWADCDSRDFTVGLDRMGAIDYTLPRALSYEEEGLFINLSAGRQLLDGQDCYDILRFPAYEGGAVQQAEEGAALMAAIINQRLPTLLSANGAALAAALLDLSTTDLSYLDYETHLPALSFLTALNSEAAFACPLSGEYQTDGVFLLDALALRLLVQNFA